MAQWVADRLDIPRGFGPCQAIGVRDGLALVGGVVFHNWMPETGVIEMSAVGATPRWMSRTVIRTMFGYCYDTMGCQLVVWRVAEDNHRTRRLAERLGFTGYPIPRLRGRDRADIIYTLPEEEWRQGRFERAAHV